MTKDSASLSLGHIILTYAFHDTSERGEKVSLKHKCSGPEMTHHFPFICPSAMAGDIGKYEEHVIFFFKLYVSAIGRFSNQTDVGLNLHFVSY